ncbi:MAG TPA: biliverdin-producing heme oxygenase [Steroidobacteraceae bacterium]
MIDLLSVRSTSGVFNILERLRRSTREQHRALDTALSRYDLSLRKDYEAFLGIHWRALTELQNQWRKEDDAEFARLSSMIKNDLGCKGATPPQSYRTQTQESARAHAIGVCYVIRGSRLGAALLRRRVPEDFPAAYLSAQLELSWRDFLLQLENYARSAKPAEILQAVCGARAAFGVFSRTQQEQQPNE